MLEKFYVFTIADGKFDIVERKKLKDKGEKSNLVLPAAVKIL